MAVDVKEALARDYDAIVVGSGFGASVAITMLVEQGKNVLVLERGTWWGNPEGPPKKNGSTVKVDPFSDLGTKNRQWWPRPNDAKGINYMLDSIYKEEDPMADLFLQWRSKDRDLGPKSNRKGLYRVTRLGNKHGKVDIVSGSGVGGGSLFYSGVNLRPQQDVLDRIGLAHLDDDAFDEAGRWMQTYRGRINKVATLVPVPHREGSSSSSYRLREPKNGFGPEYEMPDPKLAPHEEDSMLIARSSLLRDARNHAMERKADGTPVGRLTADGAEAEAWHPLPLSVVEYDPMAWDADEWTLDKTKNKIRVETTLIAGIDRSAVEFELTSITDLPINPAPGITAEFSLLISSAGSPSEIVTVTAVSGNKISVLRGQWHSSAQSHAAASKVQLLGRGNSDRKNSFCLREGRCMVGCLPSARHTLYKTIQVLVQRRKTQDELGVLPVGDRLGVVQVIPQAKVSHIAKADPARGRYEVFFDCFLEDADGDRHSKSSKVVFIGAGTLGTTEILLRSRDKVNAQARLALPATLGHGFSTNGDFFGFAINVDHYEPGTGKKKPFRKRRKANPTVGPINASGFNVAWPQAAGAPMHVNVEDAGIPPMFARFIKTIIPGANKLSMFLKLGRAAARHLLNLNPFDSHSDPDPEERRQESYLTGRELLSDLFFFNLMGAGPQEPLGTFRLDKDGSGLQLRYLESAPLHEWSLWDRAIATMSTLTDYMSPKQAGGQDGEHFVPSPFWKDENRFTVVHPLGGCTVGGDKTQGAVDDLGRVYDEGSNGVLDGLYVVDASVIPGAIGVNPTLTLVAQAVRTVNSAIATDFP